MNHFRVVCRSSDGGRGTKYEVDQDAVNINSFDSDTSFFLFNFKGLC